MEAHPAVPSKEDRAGHSLVGDKIHPYSKGSGWCTLMVELNCHLGRSASAEHHLGANPLHDLVVVAWTLDAPAAPVATIGG